MSSPARRTVWIVPSLGDLVFLAVLAAALGGGSRMLSADGDPGRHLTVGKHIVESRSIPDRDIFSHTMAGQPFVPYEWLSEVLSALSYQAAGPAGPVLLHGALIAATFAVVFAHIRTRGSGGLMALAVSLLAMVVSAIHWLARPHVFTFLGTAVFWSVLDLWRSGKLSARWLWILPGAMLFWSNIHGGFLVGLILLGAFIGAELLGIVSGNESAMRWGRLRVLGPVAVATLVAGAITPVGGSLFVHVTGYLGKRLLVDRTIEYMSPNFHDAAMLPFMLMLVATVAALAWSARRPGLTEGLVVLVFVAFALYAGRNIPLFAIIAAPVLASQIEALPSVGGRVAEVIRAWARVRNSRIERMEQSLGGHVWPIAALIGATLVGVVQWQGGEPAPLGERFDPRLQPVEAVAHLRTHPQTGNGFNELGWGGYVLHGLWPWQRVFIDGQTDFYGEPLVREYLQVVELRPGWQQILDKYSVRWVLYGSDSSLVQTLTATPGWRVEYRDTLATVLSRDGPAAAR